ncbi:MAG: hypothetical protein L3J81_05780, partial [Thermoplasmata archaeon]|nr:hypothetical protein [Thermoplasmata archaeon]
MKPAASGAASGVVIGISAVILLQQLALISLSDLVTGLVYLLVAALAAGVVFGIGGWLLGRSAMHRAQAMLAKEGPTDSAPPPKVSDSAAPAKASDTTPPTTDGADAPKSS